MILKERKKMAIAVICVCFSFILSSRLTYSHIFSIMSNTAYSASYYSWLHFDGLSLEASPKSIQHVTSQLAYVSLVSCICIRWLVSLYLSIFLCARRITILNIICNMIMLIVSILFYLDFDHSLNIQCSQWLWTR